MRFSFLCSLAFLVLLAGCQSSHQLAVDDLPEPERTLVYIIHGDASYLYHSPDNEPLQADEETVRRARHVAKNAPDAEVLIFHQKPKTYRFGILPQADGKFYHYRGGELVSESSYDREPEGLAPEAALYSEHRSEASEERTLLYFGHELPDPADEFYHQSHPDVSFGVAQLANGLAGFEDSSAGEKPFDMIVLSTCSNGTPATLAHLSPLTRYVLASPEELHLTYFDSEPLHNVASDASLEDTARRLAQHSFDRLEARTRTAVTVALYDVEQLAPGMDELRANYEAIRTEPTGDTNLVDYVDCYDAGLDQVAGMEGVDVWFRPAQFGAGSDRVEHSGWGCPVTPSWLGGK